jgi:hypothetical protein
MLKLLLTSLLQTGIGKSMVSYLMLYRCCTQNRRVVFRKAGWKGERAHLFCEDGVFRLDELEFERELERPDVLYVVLMYFCIVWALQSFALHLCGPDPLARSSSLIRIFS